MNQLFIQLLNMSITASWVIFFVIGFRILLKKAPKIFSYALWSVVFFRLVCPFSFQSVLSILPINTSSLSSSIVFPQAPQPVTENLYNNHVIQPILSAPISRTADVSLLQDILILGRNLWIISIIVLLCYCVISLIRIHLQLKTAKHEENNIYLSDKIETPFVIGLFYPKIYLPTYLSSTEKQFILLHEQTHIRRFDHLIKMISYFILCIHWFNPFVWISFLLMTRDMEMSCDEHVIKKLGGAIKKEYSTSLLILATNRRFINGTPLAFGEGDTKSRIKNVLTYKKPKFWMILVCIIVVIGIIFGLISNPKDQGDKSPSSIADSKTATNELNSTEEYGDTSTTKGDVLAPESELFKGIFIFRQSVNSSENIAAITNKESINSLMTLLNSGTLTRYESVQDTPTNIDNYIKFSAGDFLCFLYEKNDKYYIEQPYNGIFELSKDSYHAIMESTTKNGEANYIIKNDGKLQWEVRLSENKDNYNSPFKRYELIRVDLTSSLWSTTILDDCLWDETITKPIIFADYRIIYAAAKDDTLTSAKSLCLVSIKGDGSDRRIYEAPYGVAKHLSYDNSKLFYEGFTNDQAFPRPIYQMNSDFTKLKKVTDIDGSLITVYENFIYYLGQDKNKLAIYTVSLESNTSSTPTVYDKSGFNAQEWKSQSVNISKGDDLRAYANIVFLSTDDYSTTKAYTLPLYAHEGQ